MNSKELKMETEANAFALALLIPEAMLISEIKKIKGKVKYIDTFITILAKKFAVSECAMKSRLYNLGLINQL